MSQGSVFGEAEATVYAVVRDAAGNVKRIVRTIDGESSDLTPEQYQTETGETL